MTARKQLRRGWTTGTCAAAAARAAYHALVTGTFPDPAPVRLPDGRTVALPLARAATPDGAALAAVVKDAGDDPDVTHGCEVVARVAWGPAGGGVVFAAGEGVGRVTLPGLPVPVGEPAINPVPRAMIADNIGRAAAALGTPVDVTVTLSIPGGETLARRTMNPRLGIVGGLSILGTTGIVVPYSCSAWVHAIHSGVDVARALGLGHIAAATGRTSEAAVRRLCDLPEPALIDMGDFAGALLKYLRRRPVPRLTIAGGFGKLCKLAAGHMDLHSRRSAVDVALLAEMLAAAGADAATVRTAADAATAAQVLDLAGALAAPLAARVAARARTVAAAATDGRVAVDVAVFDRAGRLLGHAGP